MVDLLRFLKVLQQHVLVWVTFALLNSLWNFFFSICVNLFVQQGNVGCQGIENQHSGHCHRSPCADELHSRGHRIVSILEHVHPSERDASSARVSREVTLVTCISCSEERVSCMRSSLVESQSLALSKFSIAPTNCVVMRPPSVFVRCDSGFVQIVFNFFLISLNVFLLGSVHFE